MRIGVPKEIKNHEYRVGLTPAGGARAACTTATRCWCRPAPARASAPTTRTTGPPARSIAADAAEVFASAEMIVKVKEPQPVECAHAAPGPDAVHLPAPRARPRADARPARVAAPSCIAYETVTDRSGGLPLLAPMSEVAGRMAIQAGAHCLEKRQRRPRRAAGRRARRAAGARGRSSAAAWSAPTRRSMAVGMGAQVTVLDRSARRVCATSTSCSAAACTTRVLQRATTSSARCWRADLVIGARAGARRRGAEAGHARRCCTRMKPGAVIVDVAIDQGGCFETSHADHPRRPDLRGRRRRALLRGQHAGRACRAPRPSR